MKHLTDAELKVAPQDVLYIYMSSLATAHGFPTFIGSSQLERAIKNHPEYFPDEVEHRRKWASVPEEVKQAHDAEYERRYALLRPGFTPWTGVGIMALARRTPEAIAYEAMIKDTAKAAGAMRREVHNQFYGPYGL